MLSHSGQLQKMFIHETYCDLVVFWVGISAPQALRLLKQQVRCFFFFEPTKRRPQ